MDHETKADQSKQLGCEPKSGIDGVREWPEDGKWRYFLLSLNDKLLYSYMSPVLRKGAILHQQRKVLKDNVAEIGELSMDDLYTRPAAMASKHLSSEFWRLRNEQQSVQNNWTLRGKFILILWGIAKPIYISAGMCQLVELLALVSGPVLLRQVLIQLEEHPNENFARTGLPIGFGLFAASIIEGLARERQKFLAFQTGIILKSAVVTAVYEHVLALTPAGKSGLTSGETTNLIAIDSQKIFELVQEGHQVWACPLAMIIITVLLLLEIGPSALAGMLSMFLLIPLVRWIVSKMVETRKKRVQETDHRVNTTTSMLQSIKFTKLNHYEDKFLKRVNEARQREMKLLRMELFWLGTTLVCTVISPVIATGLTFTTYVLINEDNTLSSATTFTTLVLFSTLRFPINYVGKLIGKAAQGLQSCERFGDFFSRESRQGQHDEILLKSDINSCNGNTEEAQDTLLKVIDGRFSVGSMPEMDEITKDNDTSFTVSNIQISLKRSEILFVVGPVASGKTILCDGLLGDLSSKSSALEIKGKVAFASQNPFILNATLRENILFGSEFDEERYAQVLEACCLLADLDQISPARDLTEIGERGVTLSGGQKQRVSIARVAYSLPDVAIFDDPLSALDAATGKAVFEKLFKSKDSVLSNSAIVLVTHASHFLHRVDKIMILHDGQPAFMGKWDELSNCAPSNIGAAEAVSAIRSAVQEDRTEDETISLETADTMTKGSLDIKMRAAGDLMTTEQREFGVSDWRTWLKWFKYAGGFPFVVVTIAALFMDRFLYVATEWWLASWTRGETEPITRFGHEFPPQTEGYSAQYEYLTVFGIIFSMSCIAAAVRAQWLIQAGARCSNTLFNSMTVRVIRAPMSYFETTPLGRILTRFTYDIEMLDMTMTLTMTMLMTAIGWFSTGIILMVVILPWQIITLTFIIVSYCLLVFHYRKSAVDLQRLDATSRSPVQAQLTEVLDGASTIRVFKKVPYFTRIFRSSLDENTSAMMNFMTLQRWVSVRIHLAGACTVLVAVCAVVSFNEVLRIPPGIAAILLIWSSSFPISLMFMIQTIAESEAALTSVERIVEMAQLPQEKNVLTDDNSITLKEDWPSTGKLIFDNVTMRYRPGLPLSLKGLSFSLESGQRCGVVGRTGAGKSTLTVALFRLVEIESGKITLDGVDLSTLGLSDVRGRRNGMCIIPQDPVLFSGSLRECLDPFNDSTDDQVMDALRAVRVANASERSLEALEDFVEDGGSNYSVGERQLLCLARAILVKPKILVLDEATASLDGETDAFIQRMLRTRFKGTTLLTIAHRLNTIMDYDVILGIDEGKAAEFGSPKKLLEQDGLFSSLVASTGKQSAAALRRMALSSET